MVNDERLYENSPSTSNVVPIKLPEQRRCLSHSLNLLSHDFEKTLPAEAKNILMTSLNKLHALWVFTHRSSYAKTLCKEIIDCCLDVPCPTRWNGTFDAVAKCLRPEIKAKINILIDRIKLEIKRAVHLRTLTAVDWAVLEQYIAVMTPIATSLDRLQGEKNASQGFIIPTLISMKYRISTLDGSNLLKIFKKTALDAIGARFDRYYGVNEANRDLILASLSIPQFKTTFIENSADERKARAILSEQCLRETNLEDDTNENNTHVELDVATNDDFFLIFNHTEPQRRTSIEGDIDSEISRYLGDSRKEITILNDYKYIKKIYFKFNTTLSSSAPVERVFSNSKLIFRPQRNRLSAENFERTLLLRVNRKYFNIN